jgi:MFS family permease
LKLTVTVPRATAPALPAITTEFHTVDDIGWYSSVYLLVQMSCQPVFGRLLQFYEPKMFYMVSLGIFQIGSIVCATSPSSIALILGRAVAGSGAAGIVTGSLAIFGDSAPMRERPRGMAVIAALQSVAYLAGPILSGALTDSWLTWRFNFWLNLRQYYPKMAVQAIELILVV